MNTVIEDRDIRQRELIPPEKLQSARVTVVGVGAGGRQVALQLAAIGVPRITLIDPDTVRPENLAAQGYHESDLGRPKVDATRDLCQSINSEIEVTTIDRKFRSMDFSGGVMFCCVDKIDTRKAIFEAVQQRADLFIDGRMSAEYARIFIVYDDASREHYATTLFPAAEAYRGACTAKTTIYCANVSAGLRVAQFAKWLRGCDLDKEIDINMLTNEMGAQ
ncbi:MAG: ThiF family adenylyltransferase [Chloroflexi bacterium]|nr:MAG: ThiF family adenylyltransferase [Chloroflexota bacterium]